MNARTNTARHEALVQGLSRYFTGEPCVHGHVAERMTANKRCVTCAKTAATLHRHANPERERERNRRAYQENREKRRASYDKWREKNRPYLAKAKREWSTKNPERARALGSARRARERAAEGSYSAQDITEILLSQRGRCAYCRVDFKSAKYQVDHIQPLSCGGSNDRTNIQLVCRPCNSSKGARDPIIFAQKRGMLL